MSVSGTSDDKHGGTTSLKIVHCFREPVGGLFRHVRDLAEAQHKAGHAVGVVCDASTGGGIYDGLLDELKPFLSLGLVRYPMRRNLAPSDLAAAWRIARIVRPLAPDVLHGHGAKGGAYARTIGTLLRATGQRVARIYTPHGGSLHFDAKSLAGRIYFLAERGLGRMTDGFIFVSQYEADTYAAKVGRPRAPATVIPNGLRPEEFEPLETVSEPVGFLFIGTLREIKGPDVFLDALALLRKEKGQAPSAVIVGDGEEKPRYVARAGELGLGEAVIFHDAMPARSAFSLARAVVVPSRAESMPYVVLEAIAAALPIVATNVGGIPEIFGPRAGELVPPGDAQALAGALERLLADPAGARSDAQARRDWLRPRFNIASMQSEIDRLYRDVLAGKQGRRG
jgi:glycosyltransferase involved in cell wall biosynthesis